jgi:hypothetical protein
MNPFGNPSAPSFETAWEKGQSTVKQLIKPVSNQVKQVTQMTRNQIMGTPVRTDPISDFPKHNPVEASPDNPMSAQTPTQTKASPNGNVPQYQKGHMSGTDMQLSQTRAKLAALQQQHKTSYYDPTFNRPKPKEQPVAEKLEQQKHQEMAELAQKEEKKKKDNVALKMSTHKAEMFRGAAG